MVIYRSFINRTRFFSEKGLHFCIRRCCFKIFIFCDPHFWHVRRPVMFVHTYYYLKQKSIYLPHLVGKSITNGLVVTVQNTFMIKLASIRLSKDFLVIAKSFLFRIDFDRGSFKPCALVLYNHINFFQGLYIVFIELVAWFISYLS